MLNETETRDLIERRLINFYISDRRTFTLDYLRNVIHTNACVRDLASHLDLPVRATIRTILEDCFSYCLTHSGKDTYTITRDILTMYDS